MQDVASILELPADERLRLVEAIWDSLVETPEAVTLTPETRDELERRLRAYDDDPSAVRSWEDVRKDIFGSK